MSERTTGAYPRSLSPYPFAELDARREEMLAAGKRLIDLGMGEPREPVPDVLQRALTDSIGTTAPYPRAAGLPELRQAAAAWCRRRYATELDPDRHVLPANGTKEAIFHLPLALLEPGKRDHVLVPDPGYPVYRLGTLAAGGTVVPLPLRADAGFLPDLDAVPETVWERTALVFLNSPHNPTGAVAPGDWLRGAVERCREHGVWVVSDEAYAEIYSDQPPAGVLESGVEGVLALHSLSKRSSVPGWRSGFMAGDPALIDTLRAIRPGIGVATPDFIQRASALAWADEGHVAVQRERYRDRLVRSTRRLAEAGFTVPEPAGTFFIWLPVPPGSVEFTRRALEAGVVVLPGSVLGEAGEGFVRISLTATDAEIDEGISRIASLSV